MLGCQTQSQQRLRVLRRTIATESDEQLLGRMQDFIDRKQPTAKRSLPSILILPVQICVWIASPWVPSGLGGKSVAALVERAWEGLRLRLWIRLR